MRPITSHHSPTAAILALAEIKAAIEVFDRGDANVLAVLNTIVIAVEAYVAAAETTRKAA